MSDKYAVGDWVRWSEAGQLKTGVVFYCRDSQWWPHRTQLVTDNGIVDEDLVLERRGVWESILREQGHQLGLLRANLHDCEQNCGRLKEMLAASESANVKLKLQLQEEFDRHQSIYNENNELRSRMESLEAELSKESDK